MGFLKRVVEAVAGFLDRLREPGWHRWFIVFGLLVAVSMIPYPLRVAGEFEIISLASSEVRTLTEGILEEVLVKAGTPVKEGEVVARILARDLELERARLEAELDENEAMRRLAEKGFRVEDIQKGKLRREELEASVALAERVYERNKELHKSGFIQVEVLDASESDLIQKRKLLEQAGQEFARLRKGFREEEIDQARAKAEQLRARIAELDQRVAWTQVKSPIAGIIVTPDHQIKEQLGRNVPRGAQILTVVTPADLVARIFVPEHEFGDVAVGQPTGLRAFQFPNEVVAGIVDHVEPLVQEAEEERPTSTVPVISKIKNDDAKLRLGSTGMAKVECRPSHIGYLVYRRFLRSLWVQIWSWY